MKIVTAKLQPIIIPEQAQILGAQLSKARLSRGLSVEQVADRLLFSKHQIHGLEAGERNYFYGSKLYAQAADKYAEFMELDILPSALLFAKAEVDTTATELEDDSIPTSDDNAPSSLITATSALLSPQIRKNIFRVLTGAGLIFILLLTGQTLLDQDEIKTTQTPGTRQAQTIVVTSASPADTLPPTTVSVATLQPPPAPEKPLTPTLTAAAQSPSKDTLPVGNIRLSFTGPSWIQAVETNGQKQERTYREGEFLVLEPAKLQALIIGNASVVSVSAHTGEIGLTPYTNNGSQVARLVGPQIRQLATK